jgi:hypothetical protein
MLAFSYGAWVARLLARVRLTLAAPLDESQKFGARLGGVLLGGQSGHHRVVQLTAVLGVEQRPPRGEEAAQSRLSPISRTSLQVSGSRKTSKQSGPVAAAGTRAPPRAVAMLSPWDGTQKPESWWADLLLSR